MLHACEGPTSGVLNIFGLESCDISLMPPLFKVSTDCLLLETVGMYDNVHGAAENTCSARIENLLLNTHALLGV